MRSRKRKSTTKYICKGWKECRYALGTQMGDGGHPCFQGLPYPNDNYIGPNGKPGPYKSIGTNGMCNGVVITPKMKLEIELALL